MPTRRDFVATSLAAAASLRLPNAMSDSPLATAVIPSSGERLARVGLGTWLVFDVGADATRRAQLAEVLQRFLASGASVIDTSPMYGTAESVLGDVLAVEPQREKAWVATKVWTTGIAQGEAQMTTSLARLKRTRVEAMQVHNLVDWANHLRTIRQWKEAGRIRYVGVSHYLATALDDVAAVVRREPLDVVQINLSLDEPEAAQRLIPQCADAGVAVIANRPFGGGGALRRVRALPLPAWCAEIGITSWAQFMIKWVLSHDGVTVTIPGTGNPRHLVDNLDGARGTIPDAALRRRMATAWAALPRG